LRGERNCDEKCDDHTVILENMFLHEFGLGIVWIVNLTTGMNELKYVWSFSSMSLEDFSGNL
jgi:hypothetical protein